MDEKLSTKIEEKIGIISAKLDNQDLLSYDILNITQSILNLTNVYNVLLHKEHMHEFTENKFARKIEK